MIAENYVSEDITPGANEELGRVPKVFVIQQPTRFSPVTTYQVIVQLTLIEREFGSPVATYTYGFDPVTGEYLGRSEPNYVASWYTFFNAFAERDGSIWWMENFGGQDWLRFRLTQGDNPTWTPTGEIMEPATYDPQIGHPVAIDTPRRLVLSGTGLEVGTTKITVYDMDTKLLLRTIDIGSDARQIIMEDDSRCFVICDYGIIVLLNYVTGVVLGTFRIEYHADQLNEEKFHAWDQFTRRLLVTAYGGGAKIRGYYPVPQAVGLTEPIPLEVPRVGRTVRVATRAFGDTGEGIGGIRVDATSAIGGTLRSAKAMTGATGWAIHHLTCLSADPASTFDVEAELP